MITAEHFKESEFRRCTPSCSMQDMQQSTMRQLDLARDIAGIPFVLNSAYRSKAWEVKKGRPGTSSHTKGLAVDIRCNTDANRYKIVKAALECGVRRIGIAQTYIHIDCADDHAQDVIWDYYGG